MRLKRGPFVSVKFYSNDAGFTLVEMIMVLVLLGIMGAVAGFGLNQFIQGYILTKEAAESMSKAQLAMLRISKEFRVIGNVSSGTVSSITFTAKHGSDLSQQYTISQPAGTDEIKLSDGTNVDTLVDQVNSFVLNYYDTFDGLSASTWTAGTSKLIEVVLTMNGPDSQPTVFTTRIVPRNI
nr:prepilin-type N-terminal cleavage/methylation domain-containing protein [Desulfobulbaceae bacterium]